MKPIHQSSEPFTSRGTESSDYNGNPRLKELKGMVIKSNPSVEMQSGEDAYSLERLKKAEQLFEELSSYGIKTPKTSIVQAKGAPVEFWGEDRPVNSFTVYEKVPGIPMDEALESHQKGATEKFDEALGGIASYVMDKYLSSEPVDYLDDFYIQQFVWGRLREDDAESYPIWVDTDPVYRSMGAKNNRSADELVDFAVAAGLVVDMYTEAVRTSGSEYNNSHQKIQELIEVLETDTDPRGSYIANKLTPGLETNEILKNEGIQNWAEEMRQLQADPIAN